MLLCGEIRKETGAGALASSNELFRTEGEKCLSARKEGKWGKTKTRTIKDESTYSLKSQYQFSAQHPFPQRLYSLATFILDNTKTFSTDHNYWQWNRQNFKKKGEMKFLCFCQSFVPHSMVSNWTFQSRAGWEYERSFVSQRFLGTYLFPQLPGTGFWRTAIAVWTCRGCW